MSDRVKEPADLRALLNIYIFIAGAPEEGTLREGLPLKSAVPPPRWQPQSAMAASAS